ELYPHVLYRSANPLGNGQYLMPPTVPDGAFDRVFCLDTIVHFDPRQRDELMEMLATSLKPGGWLVVTAAGIDPGDLEALCASHGLHPLQSAAAPGSDDLEILGAVFYR